MKIQLTKTKTIEFSLPGGGGAGGMPTDIVGVEVGNHHPQGCPAVRIARAKNGGWRLLAADFVPSPGEMPAEAGTVGAVRWSLPPAFRAPAAALVVDSPRAFARMTTLEAIAAAPVPPESAGAVASSASAAPRKLGVKRQAPASTSETPPPPAAPAQVEAGKITVYGGMRFMARSIGDGALVFQTGLPDCQVAWAARLLPEGRRPTARSIQTLPAALLSALLRQPGFLSDNGNGVALFVTETSAFYAGYREGRPVLFGECPGVGARYIRSAVSDRFGIEESLVDSFLEDGFFESGDVLAPIVNPALQQLRTTLDYIMGRHRVSVSRVHLLGVRVGTSHWIQLAESVMRFPLSVPNVFEGLESLSGKDGFASCTTAQSQAFVGALGAALALGEGEA